MDAIFQNVNLYYFYAIKDLQRILYDQKYLHHTRVHTHFSGRAAGTDTRSRLLPKSKSNINSVTLINKLQPKKSN